MVSKNEKILSFESGVLQIGKKSNKIDKNERFLNKEFSKSGFGGLVNSRSTYYFETGN